MFWCWLGIHSWCGSAFHMENLKAHPSMKDCTCYARKRKITATCGRCLVEKTWIESANDYGY